MAICTVFTFGFFVRSCVLLIAFILFLILLFLLLFLGTFSITIFCFNFHFFLNDFLVVLILLFNLTFFGTAHSIISGSLIFFNFALGLIFLMFGHSLTSATKLVLFSGFQHS